MITTYVVGSALSGALPINPTDLDAFFVPSARMALTGHSLDVYSVRHDSTYPDANGPLSLVPLAGVTAVAAGLGRLDDLRLRRILVMATFAIFPLLLAREAVLAIDRLRGHRVPGRRRPILHVLFAAPPLIWQSALLYGHIEQPLCLWLTLYGVRTLLEERPRRAGVLFGLAVLSRTASALLILPVLMRLIVRRGHRDFWSTAVPALGIVAAGLAPFLIAHGADTVYSLVTYRGSLPVGGGSIWYLATGTPVEGWVQHADGFLVILGVLIFSEIVLWRRPSSRSPAAEVYGLLALSAIFFPLLAKTVWPYYLLDVYVMATIWAVGSWRLRLVRGIPAAWLVPVLVSACGLAAELGVTATLDPVWRRAESAAMFLALAALAATLTVVLIRGRDGALENAGMTATGVAPAGGGSAA